jgi:hypothetical protein
MVSYHGIFGGYKVLSMSNSLPRVAVNIYVEIAGHAFQFIGDESGLYVYNAPNFINLSVAYQDGLISNEDVFAIWQLVNWVGEMD